MHYIGIDGGGTKTQFTLFDEHGKTLSFIQLPSCHILQKASDEIILMLQSGVETLIQQVSTQEVMICAGLAGYGNDANMRKQMEAICAKAFHPYSYIIKNDSQIALAGALDGQDGILLIAGTGSIALAKQGNQEMRCGGWGYMLGDEGSAYAIAKSLLAHYCRQCDGREAPTLLKEKVAQHCNLQNDYEIIPYIANTLHNERDKIAQLAMIVSDLANQGDVAAKAIFEEAGTALAQLANTLRKQFTDNVLLSYVGGVWKSDDLIMKPFQSHLDPPIEVVQPLHDPVYGAYLLAKQAHDQL